MASRPATDLATKLFLGSATATIVGALVLGRLLPALVLWVVVIQYVAITLHSRALRRGVDRVGAAAHRIAASRQAAAIDDIAPAELEQLGPALDALATAMNESVSDLAAERDVLSNVLTSMRDGVLLVDGGGHIVLTNPALRDMLLLREQHLGQPVEVAVNVPALHELLVQARRERGPAQDEIAVGGLRPRRVLVRAEPLQLPAGAVLATFHDVTDLRRLETLRRDFVANASHELRTPISSLRTATETLLSMGPDEEDARKRFLGIVERNAARLQQLADDLLDLSRVEAREVKVASEPIELYDVVTEVAALLREKAASTSTQLVIDVDRGSTCVLADRRALSQVVQNLVDNAIKYGPGSTVTISASAVPNETTRPLVELKVSDTGPGLESRHLHRIFERFYRVDPSRSRQLGGTGLGLSIVKLLVEAMTGTIDVTSTLGAGTTFTVELPRAPLVVERTEHEKDARF